MKRFLRIFFAALAILTGAYFIWSTLGRTPVAVNVQLHLDSTYVLNADSGKGNVIGINAYMTPDDYVSKPHFQSKLKGYLDLCRQKGWMNRKTVVIFPEHIGTCLVMEGEKRSVIQKTKVDEAVAGFVLSNFFSYIRSWFMAPDSTKDKVKHSVFATKGQRMADIYAAVFSSLAKEYGVTIIGGSILLQDPRVVRKRSIDLRNGSLENVTAVFNPDGTIRDAITRKAFPATDELTFIQKGRQLELPMYNLPVGNTSVMIGADAWYPERYEAARKDAVTLLAVPSYTPTDKSMGMKWQGYSGFDEPRDADTTDIGSITLRQAWEKYAMPARIRSINAPYGIAVSLRGKLWDLGTDGECIVYNRGQVFSPGPMQGASLVNVWIQ